MGIQISFLIGMVAVAVSSTRLIYHDGVSRHYCRMGIHCKMLAALIVTMALYAASIGFKIHEHYILQIQQKDSQINALSHRIPAEGVGKHGQVVLTTVGGNKIALGEEDGLRNGTVITGCGSSELRRSAGAEGCEPGRSRSDRSPGDGGSWSVDDGMVSSAELLEQFRTWTDGCFSRRDSFSASKDSVSF